MMVMMIQRLYYDDDYDEITFASTVCLFFYVFFLTSELDELNGTLLKTSPKLCQGPKIHYKPHQPKAGFGLVIMMMMIKIFIFLVSCTIAEPGCRVNLVPFLNWCLVDIKVFLVT